MGHAVAGTQSSQYPQRRGRGELHVERQRRVQRQLLLRHRVCSRCLRSSSAEGVKRWNPSGMSELTSLPAQALLWRSSTEKEWHSAAALQVYSIE